MLEGICMCCYKAIVQNMFKHVTFGNGLLVVTLPVRGGGGGGAWDEPPKVF